MEEEKLESLHTVGKITKWSSHWGKQYGGILKNFYIDYVIPFLELRQDLVEIFVHPCAVAALFTIAKRWKQSKYPRMKTWIHKMWYIHNHGIIFSLKKERNSDTCHKVDETWWFIYPQPYLQTSLILKIYNGVAFLRTRPYIYINMYEKIHIKRYFCL